MMNEVNDGLNKAASAAFGSQGIGPFAKTVKHQFLESELKTADDLIQEYETYARLQMAEESGDSAARQKLLWLLERLQESVL